MSAQILNFKVLIVLDKSRVNRVINLKHLFARNPKLFVTVIYHTTIRGEGATKVWTVANQRNDKLSVFVADQCRKIRFLCTSTVVNLKRNPFIIVKKTHDNFYRIRASRCPC